MRDLDIGREPALTFEAEASNESPNERRGINFRWLASTVLTGVAGGALMGGALFIAFDRQSQFAESPSVQFAGLRSETAGGGTIGAGKGDRVIVRSDDISSRQVIQETSVRRVDGKEFVKVTPYVRVTASLPIVRTEFAEKAPTFNPLKIFSEVGAWNDDRSSPNLGEDESVAVAYRPFDGRTTRETADMSLDVAEIEQTIRENVDFVATEVSFAAPALLPTSATGYATLGPAETASSLAPEDLARFAVAAPSNVTTVFKRFSEAGEVASEELTIKVQKGDSLVSILTDNGATPQEAAELIDLVIADSKLPDLQIDDEVRLTVAPAADDPERHRPVAITLPEEGDAARTVALALATPLIGSKKPLQTSSLRRSTAAPSNAPRANVYEGLFDAGYRTEVPSVLVDELIKVFSFDVDFQRTVSAGDLLEVFYAETGEEETSDDPELLFASINLRGETKRFYRFRTPDDGVIDFYDETGKSAKKFLMRKPVSGGTFRSSFGMRRHPILGYTRMHSGVDWAARTGTPIMASGNGTIAYADWKSGYGRHIRIRHANGYETSYSHMSGFARGIAEGSRVRQGQIIGYIGSTGLSTGPHLHYEVMVNGRNVDPMRIRLPRGRVLDGRMLAAFEKERVRIDALMNRAPASTQVASR
ncbi:M23 family metallopeptidase [Microbaculum sp. FT89]|uniref:M23 family metallopeptidase n=1 Tax=Microbaculum sp. FT89 TaxID=3447298 RepID=UPI003F530546